MDAALDVLACSHEAEAIAAAVARWEGAALEDALNHRGVPAALVRSDAQWAAHPQGQWLAARPVVEIEQVAGSSPEPLAAGERPLTGVRVLDITHVLCGPSVGRAMAEQGADVLRVASPDCADPEAIIIDTGWGKRSTSDLAINKIMIGLKSEFLLSAAAARAGLAEKSMSTSRSFLADAEIGPRRSKV